MGRFSFRLRCGPQQSARDSFARNRYIVFIGIRTEGLECSLFSFLFASFCFFSFLFFWSIFQLSTRRFGSKCFCFSRRAEFLFVCVVFVGLWFHSRLLGCGAPSPAPNSCSKRSLISEQWQRGQMSGGEGRRRGAGCELGRDAMSCSSTRRIMVSV